MSDDQGTEKHSQNRAGTPPQVTGDALDGRIFVGLRPHAAVFLFAVVYLSVYLPTLTFVLTLGESGSTGVVVRLASVVLAVLSFPIVLFVAAVDDYVVLPDSFYWLSGLVNALVWGYAGLLLVRRYERKRHAS